MLTTPCPGFILVRRAFTFRLVTSYPLLAFPLFFCASDDAFARRKRSSTQNVAAAITSGGPSPPKVATVADGVAGDVGGGSEDQPRGSKGARSSRGNSVGHGGGKSDRSSSGSAVSEHSVSVNNAEEGLVEDVDWDNLGSRTVRG